jgi:MFS family permease
LTSDPAVDEARDEGRHDQDDDDDDEPAPFRHACLIRRIDHRASVLTRPLAALLAAEIVSTTGGQMSSLAVPWFVLVTTGSAKQMSVMLAGGVAGYALFGIPSGSVLAALGSRRTMLVADAVRAPLAALIPVLHWLDALSLGLLVGIAFALGVLSTPYLSAQRVIVPELLGEEAERVSRANALFQGATRISMFAGPVLAGILIGVVGAPAVLIIDAATFLVAFLLVLVFVPPRRESRVPVEEPAGVRAGLRFLAHDRLLRTWTTAFVIGDGSFQVIFAAIPVLVVTYYNASARLAGALFACWGLGAVARNAVAYRMGPRRRSLGFLAAASPVQALPLWVLAAPVPAWAAALGLVTSGVSNGLLNPTIHSLFTLRPPPRLRPNVMTASTTASTLAAPAALLIAAPLFGAWGVRPVLAGAIAGQTLAVLLISAGAIVEARARSR